MSYYSIAIDGPVAAGKTTQAKALASRLGFVYVDTGAMYRAFAVHKLWLEKEIGKEIVVIPNATLRVFLTAKAEVRAQRRWKEQCLNGVTDSYEKTLLLLKQRDREDSNRAIAPLKQADDAVLVDCTEMSIEETTDKILAFWNAKMPDWRRFD